MAIALMILGILFLKGYNVGTVLAIYAIVYAIIRMVSVLVKGIIKGVNEGIKKAIEDNEKE